jgi:hypothetical protein
MERSDLNIYLLGGKVGECHASSSSFLVLHLLKLFVSLFGSRFPETNSQVTPGCQM